MPAKPKHDPDAPKDPLILWWMPVFAIVAPILAAAWTGATADSDALREALIGFVWPGLPLYFGLVVLFVAAWKIELE